MEKSIAKLTIHNAAGLSKRELKAIASWLRTQASGLLKDSDRYSPRFTARYLYR